MRRHEVTGVDMRLIGIFQPKAGPGFAIPVFHRGSDLYVQNADKDVVVRFRACDIEVDRLVVPDGMGSFVRRVGSAKLYAYVFPDSRIVVAEFAPLARELREASPIPGIGPLGEIDVAQFVGDANWIRKARAAASGFLEKEGIRSYWGREW
jgi:hypothetical protein